MGLEAANGARPAGASLVEDLRPGPAPDAAPRPGDAPAPAWLSRGTVPSLNGLRAVSIIIVIVTHLSARDDSPFPGVPNTGLVGVEMFFVISGFLITLLLHREREKTGRISLKQFYLRRVLRIVPAYAFLLLVMFALQQLGYVSISAVAWCAALTYTSSIVGDVGWDLGHTWSLSVEEHFYLVWPFVFSRLGRRRALLACLVCIAAVPLLRAALQYFYFRHHDTFTLGPVVVTSLGVFRFLRMDCIAVGCCLAIGASSPKYRRLLTLPPICLTGLTVAAAAVLALSYTPLPFAGQKWFMYYEGFGWPTTRAVLLAVIVWCCINNRTSLTYRVLNSRAFAVLGILSYSVYLWQQFFADPSRTGWLYGFPMNVAAIFLAAVASYTLIESPFLRLKQRLAGAHG